MGFLRNIPELILIGSAVLVLVAVGFAVSMYLQARRLRQQFVIGQTKDVHVYLPILHDPTGAIPASFDERLDALMELKYRLAEDFLKPLDTEEQLGSQLVEQMASEGA